MLFQLARPCQQGVDPAHRPRGRDRPVFAVARSDTICGRAATRVLSSARQRSVGRSSPIVSEPGVEASSYGACMAAKLSRCLHVQLPNRRLTPSSASATSSSHLKSGGICIPSAAQADVADGQRLIYRSGCNKVTSGAASMQREVAGSLDCAENGCLRVSQCGRLRRGRQLTRRAVTCASAKRMGGCCCASRPWCRTRTRRPSRTSASVHEIACCECMCGHHDVNAFTFLPMACGCSPQLVASHTSI